MLARNGWNVIRNFKLSEILKLLPVFYYSYLSSRPLIEGVDKMLWRFLVSMHIFRPISSFENNLVILSSKVKDKYSFLK